MFVKVSQTIEGREKILDEKKKEIETREKKVRERKSNESLRGKKTLMGYEEQQGGRRT